MNDTLSSVPS